MDAISPFVFQKTRVVWARKHVQISGKYTEKYDFLKVIRSCKMMDIPVITIGQLIDQEYYNKCFNENHGSILLNCDKKDVNDFYNFTKVYICNVPEIDVGMIEAMKCGCRILCSSDNELANTFTEEGFLVYNHYDHQDFEEKLWDTYNNPRTIQQNKSWWDIDWSSKIYL